MGVVADVVYFALLVFLLLLIFRLIMEYVFLLARSYRPAGLVAAALELAYSVTDPPLKALRKVIPPLRIGQVSLDLGFIILFIVVRILMGVVGAQRGDGEPEVRFPREALVEDRVDPLVEARDAPGCGGIHGGVLGCGVRRGHCLGSVFASSCSAWRFCSRDRCHCAPGR